MKIYSKRLQQFSAIAILSILFAACHEDSASSIRTNEIPIISITTETGEDITSREDYVTCSIAIDGKGLYDDYSSDFETGDQIRGRGNSTWIYYDKKPYRIKLDSKTALLGMKEAKSWVLLANYRDPTNFMNAITFDMARYMNMPYTNTNRFVELYINGAYEGMYQFTEQVQQNANRIDIDEDTGVLLNLDLDDGPALSPDAGDNFYSTIYRLPVAVKHPEDPSSARISAIKEDFAVVEGYVKAKNYTGLSTVMDISSMIDFLIIQELTRNVELVSPRSMYMYKSDDGLYHFGPVWDFDGGYSFDWASMETGHNYFGSQSWLMGSSNPSLHPGDAYNYIPDFFVSMFGNQQFLEQYKARWTELKTDMLADCFEKLDNYATQCDSAMIRNADRWPIDKDYTTEIERMKTWLTTRAANYTEVIENY